ncbi:DUF6600 domain-containing protein [Echinicola sp. 20G]|uniref:DUF6600 domain-containing protein n=1 Tax=Echinicola sp. 20G TaxID=2781961 RepID=UPI00191084A3|nr:DUF6600 domain-containing protein [Echinicola sp. 20G]
MKKEKLTKWLGVTLIMWLAFTIVNPKNANAESPLGVSFQIFYDELAPYGDWVEDARYGYIWLPYADRNFHPYNSNGHWVMTEYGNTWVSYYNWGWAPFHYGRWFYDEYYGWAWVPGYEWGPAWVNWRTGGGYYGWAPMTPGFSVSVNIGIPSFHWVFVPQRRFTQRHVYRYCAPRRNIVNIYNRTTVINNTVVYNRNRYISGPSRRDIERYSRGNVTVYKVNSSQRAGKANVSRNTLNIYRPDVRMARNDNRSQNAKPRTITSLEKARSNRAAIANTNNNSNSRGNVTAPRSNNRSSATTSGRQTNVNQPSRSTRPTGTYNSSQRSSNSSRGQEATKAQPYGNRNNSGSYSKNAEVKRQSRPVENRSKPTDVHVRSSKEVKQSRVSKPSQPANRQVSRPSNSSNNRSTSTVKRSSNSANKSRSSSNSASSRSSNSRSRGNN